MPRRRGPSNQERLAQYMVNATATGALVSSPCFLYNLEFTLTDGTTSGQFSFADSTAAADVVKETSKYSVKMGTAASSGNSDNHDMWTFMPPLFISNQLFWAQATGIAALSGTVIY